MTIGSGDRTIQAAIDADHCTADVVSVRTRKIGDGGGNLFRSSEAPNVIRDKVPARSGFDFAARFAPTKSPETPVRKSSTALTRIQPGETMFEVTPVPFRSRASETARLWRAAS